MIFRYGDYTHAAFSVALRAEYFSIFDQMKRRMGEKIRFSILGVLRGTDQADLTSKINDLFDAYQLDYKDATLFLADGVTETAHRIVSADTWGGVKVTVAPSFINGPWGGQPEYANQRTYYLVLEAETRLGSGTYAWKERLLIKGTGGAKWKYSPQQIGDPQLQTLQTSTSFWYIQEGSGVSHGSDFVSPPDPLFPTIEHGDMREVGFETGDDVIWDDDASEFVIRQNKTTWKYFMEATTSQGFTAFILPGD
jgi:hypothetical protein